MNSRYNNNLWVQFHCEVVAGWLCKPPSQIVSGTSSSKAKQSLKNIIMHYKTLGELVSVVLQYMYSLLVPPTLSVGILAIQGSLVALF